MHKGISSGKIKPEDEQSTCTIDNFDSDLSQLRRHFYSPSSLRGKLYEHIYHQTITNIMNPEYFGIALCLLYMAVSQMEEAKAEGKLSEEGRWKEEAEKLRQAVIIAEKDCFCQKKRNFLEILNRKVGLNELKRQYQCFLDIESPLIYKQSEKIWRLLQLYSFSHDIPFSILTQFQVDQHLNDFTLQLAQKENEIRLQLHIESCMLEPEQADVKSMMKVESYLPEVNYSLPASYPPGFTIKQMMLLEMSMDTISLVERCEAYECPYMLFCLPFLYLLAETLSFYSHPRSLFIYRIFLTLIARINRTKNSNNPQLPTSEIDDCLVDILNFSKLTGEQMMKRLGAFLQRHSGKMSTFIPVYFHIFSFHAFQKHRFVEELFSREGSIGERRKRMRERVQAVFDYCQKYNNDTI